MAYTQLSPTGLPGQRYSFLVKDAAAAEKGIGPFTALSVIGLSGERHSFSAKTAAAGAEKGVGLFTQLLPYGLPGKRYSFAAKDSAEVEVPPIPDVVTRAGGGGTFVSPGKLGKTKQELWRAKLLREDEELLEMIASLFPTGVIH